MKKNDLTTKSRGELEQMLKELRIKLSQLRFDLADKKLKRTSELRQARVSVARILTSLRSLK